MNAATCRIGRKKEKSYLIYMGLSFCDIKGKTSPQARDLARKLLARYVRSATQAGSSLALLSHAWAAAGSHLVDSFPARIA